MQVPEQMRHAVYMKTEGQCCIQVLEASLLPCHRQELSAQAMNATRDARHWQAVETAGSQNQDKI